MHPRVITSNNFIKKRCSFCIISIKYIGPDRHRTSVISDHCSVVLKSADTSRNLICSQIIFFNRTDTWPKSHGLSRICLRECTAERITAFYKFCRIVLHASYHYNERTNQVYLPMNGVNNDWLPVEAGAHQS